MVKVLISNPISNCAIQKLQPDKIYFFYGQYNINLYRNAIHY